MKIYKTNKGKFKKKPHILLMVGRDIAGYHANLQKGFDQLGIDNYFFFERTHAYYTHVKKRMLFEKIITFLNDIIVNPKQSTKIRFFLFSVLYPIVYIIKLIAFPYFLYKYDVFIFLANYSYLGKHLDRFIIKKLGLISIDIALGSDARPPYLNGKYLTCDIKKIISETKSKKKIIKNKCKYSTYLIDHPTTSHFNERDYIPLLHMGIPFYCEEQKDYNNEIPIILHAPSNPKIKGTEIIRKVINDLQKIDKYKFIYTEIIDMPHSEVLENLQKCSFVVNELYSDTLMAGLDTEAAWFGKPSIIGGYNLNMVEETVDKKVRPPTHRIYPSEENLKKAIIQMLVDDDYRKKLGIAAQKFVQQKWSVQAVAQNYLNLILGKIPNSVYRSPYNDFDRYGCGIEKNDRQKVIKNIVSNYGESALCINDKNELLKLITQTES